MQLSPSPGSHLSPDKMPGHWVLASLGKRVLRPGGIELTQQMIHQLGITPSDQIVEFAPGLGATAQLALLQQPSSYTGVERDENAANIVQKIFTNNSQQCVVGSAEQTGLADATASIVYGEAMLTMQPEKTKQQIVSEAIRLLKPGGRYAVHELALTPDDLPDSTKQEIGTDLSRTILHGVPFNL